MRRVHEAKPGGQLLDRDRAGHQAAAHLARQHSIAPCLEAHPKLVPSQAIDLRTADVKLLPPSPIRERTHIDPLAKLSQDRRQPLVADFRLCDYRAACDSLLDKRVHET